nr:MAG TPA: hypothetical protein [Caudoviricetes sp.]
MIAKITRVAITFIRRNANLIAIPFIRAALCGSFLLFI